MLNKFKKFQDSFTKRGWFLNENILYFIKRFALIQHPFFSSLKMVLNEVYPRDVVMRVTLFDAEDNGADKILFWYGNDTPEKIAPMHDKLDRYWQKVSLSTYIILKVSGYADVVANTLWSTLDDVDTTTIKLDEELKDILKDF